LEDLGVGGRLLLKWILNGMVRRGPNVSDAGYVQLRGSCDRGNEPSAFIACGQFVSSQANINF